MHAPMDDTVMSEGEIQRIHHQITSLGERMEKGFDELKRMFGGVEERVRMVETREANCNPLVMKRLTDAENDIKTNGEEIKALKLIVGKLQHTNEILSWLLGITTVTGTALIISLISKLVGG